MLWIKGHLNVVVAGSVSLLALVGLVLGFVLPDVKAAMSEDQSLNGSLESARGAPQAALNSRLQEQLNNRQLLVEDQRKFQGAQRGTHRPLPAAEFLFPKLDTNRGRAQFEFKKQFDDRQTEILTRLKAGGLPMEEDLKEAGVAVQSKETYEKFQKEGAGGAAQTPTKPLLNPAMGGLGGSPMDKELSDRAAIMASVKKARQHWCYAAKENLDQRPKIQDSTPSIDEMWFAQFSIWIQDDILGGLHQLNLTAANNLPPGEAWVGNLPFKRLHSFNIGGFVPPVGTGQPTTNQPGGSDSEFGGSAPMTPDAVITKSGSTDTVDRVRFTLDIVVEAKALLYVVNAVSTAGFYTVTQLSYEAEPPVQQMPGYVYGPQPCLHVWMVVEGAFLRSEYELAIPPSVKEAIKAGSTVGAGGGASNSGGGARPFGGQPMPMGGPMDRRGMGGMGGGMGRPGRDMP